MRGNQVRGDTRLTGQLPLELFMQTSLQPDAKTINLMIPNAYGNFESQHMFSQKLIQLLLANFYYFQWNLFTFYFPTLL